MVALHHWQKKNLKLLIRFSKPEELNVVDDDGCTILHHVARAKHLGRDRRDKGYLRDITEV